MAANAVSKLLGALFKIPLTYLLREEGMAVYNTSFTVYVMFLAFVVSGVPVAVSKYAAQSDVRGALRMTDTATLFLCVIGALASAAMYIGAPFFALAMKEENAVAAIRLISPSVFLVAAGTAAGGFFHGTSRMTVPAVSQVTEAVIKLAAGYMLALWLTAMGSAWAAGGAAAGVTVGEAAATGILLGVYALMRVRVRVGSTRKEKRETMKELLSVAVPLLLADAALNAVSAVDTSVLRTRLIASGMSEAAARFEYGAFSGYAMTLFNLPVGILGTIGLSMLPAVAAAVADGDMKKAGQPLKKGIEMTLAISVPAAVVMWLIPERLLDALFHNTASADMLRLMSPCVVTVSLMILLSSVIRACGSVTLPSFVTTAGLIVKIGIMWVLCADRRFGIYGAMIGSNIAYFGMVVTDVIILRRLTGEIPHILRALLRPAAASAAIAAVMIYAGARIGEDIAGTAVICGAGGAVYAVVMGLSKKK